MRRLLFICLASAALLVAAVPAAALARGHHPARRHHTRTHHARVRHERFGSDSTSIGAPSSEPSAGTVASFTNGVLTITVNDGSTVSGRVTGATELRCEAAEATEIEREHADGDHGGSDDSGQDNVSGSDENHDEHGQEPGEHACDVSSLVPGTTVQEAELTVSSAGAIWSNVELVG
jgi:hypothetical protein